MHKHNIVSNLKEIEDNNSELICQRNSIPFFIGLTIVNLISILFFITQIFFYFNISVNYFSIFLALLISILITSLSIRCCCEKSNTFGHKKIFIILIIYGIIFILILFSLFFANSFIDESYDANAYHKPYSLFFVNGWNPILNTPVSILNDKIPAIDPKGNSYPKAAEIISAYLYLVSGNIESVKAINILIFFSALIITFTCFSIFLPENRFMSFIFSIIASMNPVWLMQSTQFYIDGFTFELLLIIIALILIYVKGNSNWYILFSLLMASILLFNTKSSSLLFIPLMMILFFTLLWFYNNSELRKIFLFFGILAFSLLISGYSPYLVNYLNTNSVLGPEFSEISSEEFTLQNAGYSNYYLPGFLVPRDLFIKSIFSSPSLVYSGMKNPFDLNFSSLANMTGENRNNAYGPITDLIVLLSVFVLLLILSTKKNNNIKILLISTFFIFLSVILHPACWWARFVPQFFLIPVFISLAGFITKNRAIKIFSVILILLLLTNIFVVGNHSLQRGTYITQKFEYTLNEIKHSASFPVGLENIMSPISAVILTERNIPWEICNNTIDCTNKNFKREFIHSTIIYFSSRYEINNTIDFRKGGTSDLYTTSGWSGSEDNLRWTDGDEATLAFSLEEKPESSIINFTASGFTGPNLEKQMVYLSINKKELEYPIVLNSTVRNYSIPLPPEYIKAGENCVTFIIPNATSPATLYGNKEDNRKLGIAFLSFSINSESISEKSE